MTMIAFMALRKMLKSIFKQLNNPSIPTIDELTNTLKQNLPGSSALTNSMKTLLKSNNQLLNTVSAAQNATVGEGNPNSIQAKKKQVCPAVMTLFSLYTQVSPYVNTNSPQKNQQNMGRYAKAFNNMMNKMFTPKQSNTNETQAQNTGIGTQVKNFINAATDNLANVAKKTMDPFTKMMKQGPRPDDGKK